MDNFHVTYKYFLQGNIDGLRVKKAGQERARRSVVLDGNTGSEHMLCRL